MCMRKLGFSILISFNLTICFKIGVETYQLGREKCTMQLSTLGVLQIKRTD